MTDPVMMSLYRRHSTARRGGDSAEVERIDAEIKAAVAACEHTPRERDIRIHKDVSAKRRDGTPKYLVGGIWQVCEKCAEILSYSWPGEYVPARTHGCKECALQLDFSLGHQYLATPEGDMACSLACARVLKERAKMRAAGRAYRPERGDRSITSLPYGYAKDQAADKMHVVVPPESSSREPIDYLDRLTRSLFDSDEEVIKHVKDRAEVWSVERIEEYHAALDKAWTRAEAKHEPEHGWRVRATSRAERQIAALRRRPV